MYINLKSLFIEVKINKINIQSEEIELKELKILLNTKPSNFKKFFLNEVEKGKLTFKLDLNLKIMKLFITRLMELQKFFEMYKKLI